jgi:hypothetical protein
MTNFWTVILRLKAILSFVLHSWNNVLPESRGLVLTSLRRKHFRGDPRHLVTMVWRIHRQTDFDSCSKIFWMCSPSANQLCRTETAVNAIQTWSPVECFIYNQIPRSAIWWTEIFPFLWIEKIILSARISYRMKYGSGQFWVETRHSPSDFRISKRESHLRLFDEKPQNHILWTQGN